MKPDNVLLLGIALSQDSERVRGKIRTYSSSKRAFIEAFVSDLVIHGIV